ncbi:protein kinase [bacterium]|nr:protein kinase [bacterium]
MEEITQIGKYKIVTVIGKGGMGTVFKAVDTVIKRNVAIKMMTQSSFDQETARKRFFREAQAIGHLTHPNIITIYDVGEYENMPYLVVEYLDGQDLKTMLRVGHKLSTIDIIGILIDVCDALDYSHKNNIIHRDIKPANIFVLKNKSVKLMDFGVAKIDDVDLTQTGTILGTIHYMSPEQVKGKGIDHRSDIFSLGVVIYEIFSQKRPFEGDSFTSILSHILFSEPEPFQPLDQSLPPVLSSIINKALAKDPNERYQSASELQLDLTKLKFFFAQVSQSASIQGKKIEVPPTTELREQFDIPAVVTPDSTGQQRVQERPLDRSQVKARPKPAVKPVTESTRRRPQPSPARNLIKTLIILVVIGFCGAASFFIYLNRQRFFPQLTGQVTSRSDEGGDLQTQTGLTFDTYALSDNQEQDVDHKPDQTHDRGSGPDSGSLSSHSEDSEIASDEGTMIASAQFEKYMLRARENEKIRNWSAVEQDASRALHYQPQDSEARNLLDLARARIYEQKIGQFLDEGKAAWQRQDYQATIDAMNNVLAHDRTHAEALELKRKAEQALQKPETASELPKTDSSSSFVFTKLKAEQAYSKGEYAECIKLMDSVLAQDPTNREAQELKDRAHAKLGSGVTVSLTSETKRMKQAFSQGDYDMSFRLANNILAVEPTHKEALDIRSQSKTALDQKAAEAAIGNDIDSARLLLEKGSTPQAMVIAEKLKSQYPDNDEVQALFRDVTAAQQARPFQPEGKPSLPEIITKHQQPSKLIADESIELTMTFAGYDKPVYVYVYYRVTTSSEFKKTKMKDKKGMYFLAKISGRDIDEPNFEYYFVIMDRDENILYNGSQHPYKVKVNKASAGHIVVF